MTDPKVCHDPPLGRLWFGMLAAPLAWSIAEMAGYIASGRSCTPAFPNGRAFGFEQPQLWVTLGIGVLAVIGLAGLWTAIDNVRRTRTAGGRPAFMARGGVVVSGLFLLGNLFFTLPLLLTNLCRSAR